MSSPLKNECCNATLLKKSFNQSHY